jgi:hypothetical protein
VIADKAEHYRFVSGAPMLCECSDPSCQAIFLIAVERYREASKGAYLTAPGHSIDDATPTDEDHGFWRYAIGTPPLA